MDIWFNHGAVDADLTAFFNAFIFGKMDKAPVDGLPSFWWNGFDGFTQHGFLEAFIGDADKTKTSLNVESRHEGIVIHLPEEAPDPIVSVIAIEFESDMSF